MTVLPSKLDGDTGQSKITLRFSKTPPEASSINVRLHASTSEDLLCDLGPPTRTYYKEDVRYSCRPPSVIS